jgi:hypothetical protein
MTREEIVDWLAEEHQEVLDAFGRPTARRRTGMAAKKGTSSSKGKATTGTSKSGGKTSTARTSKASTKSSKTKSSSVKSKAKRKSSDEEDED